MEKAMQKGMLIFFCGKMGSGKSTISIQIARENNAVLLSEDEWLSSLYPNQISSLEDYVNFSNKIKPLIKKHVVNILETGTNVVMDYPANTIKQRAWFKTLTSEAKAKNKLIYLKVSDEICLKQIAQRCIEMPERSAFDNEVVFEQVTKHFEEPTENENLNIEIIERNE